MTTLTKKDIQAILTPENIRLIKESQESAKVISDNIRKSLIVSTEVLMEPYTI